ncbi:peroxide stress protein YaaA [Haloferax prahovense]|jgi:cytoplasmic iron level regulating protein YaaA (DUF328/UPF0246 family)|uniref:peroxide stress protein YaaA n=1 Tax=Haloferax prahovense TaxID=381852 RepID=UPI0009DCF914|nr:DUF6884 domain-containing protein [Haloferax prahovense]
MSLLLLQSCSNSKREASESRPALELYSGYFYKIIKKAIRDGECRPDMDLKILSAKYGLLEPDEQIEYYDYRMDKQRAEELRPIVVDELQQLILEREYERVVVNMGKEYRMAIRGFDDGLDIIPEYIGGEGIGYKGHVLKRFVRGDDTVLEVSG